MAIKNSVKLILVLHPKEKRIPCFVEDIATKIVNPNIVPVYRSTGKYTYQNKQYMCECYYIVYTDNDGEGCFSLCPSSPAMGYHSTDCERVFILYDENEQPQYVYFSHHSSIQGEWVKWNNCTTYDRTLYVYVALGSHANYAYPHIALRIFGFANDVTKKDGIEKKVTKIISAYDTDIVNMTKDINPVPDYTMTTFERFIFPVRITCLLSKMDSIRKYISPR